MDSDGDQNALATPAERYFYGLLKGKYHSRSNVNIAEVPGKVRGAIAAKDFQGGDFVCEYAACVKPMKDSLGCNDDKQYAPLGLGCYALDAYHEGQWFTFDATGTINDPGRYINHGSRNTNLVLRKSVFLAGRLRIGFVAKCNIKAGEELCYNYGVRDKEIPWLISNGKAMVSQPEPSKTPAAAKKTTRLRLLCTIKGCSSRQLKPDGLLKLRQHLKQYHRMADEAQIDQLYAYAKQVCFE